MGRWYTLAADNATSIRLDGLPTEELGDRVIVARTTLPRCVVSTVFLCVDHGDVPYGETVLWETMVFPGNGTDRPTDFGDMDCQRYMSRADAEAGHAAMVEKWRSFDGHDGPSEDEP